MYYRSIFVTPRNHEVMQYLHVAVSACTLVCTHQLRWQETTCVLFWAIVISIPEQDPA